LDPSDGIDDLFQGAPRRERSERRLVQRFRALELEGVVAAPVRLHEAVGDRAIPGVVEVLRVRRRGPIAAEIVANDGFAGGSVAYDHIHGVNQSMVNRESVTSDRPV